MSSCFLKTPEYQTKLALSGISEPIFHAQCGIFLDKYGRLPNLDELSGVDSSTYLADTLNMTDVNSATFNDIMAATGTSSLEDANIAINDSYSDLEVTLIPLNTEAIVDVKHRPSIYNLQENERVETVKNPNMRVVMYDITNKLAKLYGIKINTITNKDLQQFKDIPGCSTASAFIYNNEIYVNVDVAKADAPIHEMTHLLLGSIRYKNPDLYFKLVETAEKFENFAKLAVFMEGRAKSDIMEEVFVEEVARYLAGMKSDISKLPENVKYELHYNIDRMLDTILMGDTSVKSLGDDSYKMPLSQLVKSVNSKLLQPGFYGSMDDAQQHRVLANVKEDLIKLGDLKEVCV